MYFLVAQAFIPNPKELTEIDHKDRNTGNNNVSNLQWCTHTENMAQAFQTLPATRNFCECVLTYKNEVIGIFHTKLDACTYCQKLGLSFSTMRKYNKCGDYAIKV